MQLNKLSKIFIAGHNGMVGSAILNHFRGKNYKNIYFINRKNLNLLDQKKTLAYLKKIKPNFVIIAAAKVGGILANSKQKAEFIYENLMIQSNLIHASYLVGVKKLIFLGSSCIYPKFSKQPISEKFLLTGKLEETNEAYSIAKIAGIKMCEFYNDQYSTNYLSLMPANLYGPNDNYDLEKSHFFPAFIAKAYNAKVNKKKTITIWGNGKPKRELLFVNDVAEACEYFLKIKTKHSLINIGSKEERSILDYCKFIIKQLNLKLKIKFDKTKPNGTPRKKLNTELAKRYGWEAKTSLKEGFDLTYKSFIKNLK